MIILKFTDIRLLFNFSFDFRAPPVAQKVSSLSVLWKPMIAQHSAPFQSEFSISPKYFAKVRNPIWNLACAMWNVLCKQCDGPEDPVCHEDLTFRPPDGSFESCESSTGEHSTIRRKPQTGAKSTPISLWKSLLACIGLNPPIPKKKTIVFFFSKICLLALFSFDSSADSELILFLSTHLKTQGDR